LSELSQWVTTVNEDLIGCEVEIYRGASILDKGIVNSVNPDNQNFSIMSSILAGERFYSNTTCWIVKTAERPTQKPCDCGSKHTSFPEHHLKWCSTNSTT